MLFVLLMLFVLEWRAQAWALALAFPLGIDYATKVLIFAEIK